jgi:hypothetical protein
MEKQTLRLRFRFGFFAGEPRADPTNRFTVATAGGIHLFLQYNRTGPDRPHPRRRPDKIGLVLRKATLNSASDSQNQQTVPA